MRPLSKFVRGVAAGAVGSAVLIAGGVAFTQEVAEVENCVFVVEHDKVLCDRVDAPTTTTTPSSSSSSSTTTTSPSTTSPSTTTTTTGAPEVLIPETLPYPGRGSGIPYADGGGFDLVASNATTGTIWWTAPYWGDNGLPYTDGATWLDGDREGYRCAYGFITDGTGDISGRVAFVRPPDQTYSKVNDSYMDEGVRYLDGSLYEGAGNEITEEDCTTVLSPIDYEGACRPADERPRIAYFDREGRVLDIRDYTNTNANNVVFNLHSVTETRVTVIACEDGLVGMIVYYDALGAGTIASDFNGTGPHATNN